MSDKRNRRTATEILAAKEADLEKAKIRAAKEAGKAHPVIAQVLAIIANLSKELSVARRGFVKGRQNFETRIASHQAWINEIEAERAVAEAQAVSLSNEREFYNTEASVLMTNLTSGKGVTEFASYEGSPGSDAETDAAIEVYDAARLARQNLNKTEEKEATASE